MHSFAIHEALYLNYRIPGSAVKDPWVGPIWTYTVDFLFNQKQKRRYFKICKKWILIPCLYLGIYSIYSYCSENVFKFFIIFSFDFQLWEIN